MNDQRCEFPLKVPTTRKIQKPLQPVKFTMSSERNEDAFMDMVIRIQGDRLEEQRCDFPGLSSKGKE